MPEVFKFELVSPERLLLSADVESVGVPATEGEMTVMARHAPVMTTLKAGVVTVRGGGNDRRVFVRGGFAEVGAQGLTILAEQAVPMEELDRAKLDIEIRDAEDDVKDAPDDAQRAKAADRLAQLKDLAASL